MEKKIKLQKGLTLNKEAIVKLQDAQMMNLRGGTNTVEVAGGRESCWYLLSCLSSCSQQSCNTTPPKQVSTSPTTTTTVAH